MDKVVAREQLKEQQDSGSDNGEVMEFVGINFINQEFLLTALEIMTELKIDLVGQFRNIVCRNSVALTIRTHGYGAAYSS